MMGTVPAKHVVFNWKRDHKVLDEDNPLYCGPGTDPMDAGHPDAEACATHALTADQSEALAWCCRSQFYVTDIRLAN